KEVLNFFVSNLSTYSKFLSHHPIYIPYCLSNLFYTIHKGKESKKQSTETPKTTETPFPSVFQLFIGSSIHPYQY
ncbi:MAG: hypothetical protein NW224_18330, partial [Leptolyngbyaceae cyanobacterium bins.302]|nr:hypothetical protein [Leptolyngbyaceae cyanobacterium bins.302]